MTGLLTKLQKKKEKNSIDAVIVRADAEPEVREDRTARAKAHTSVMAISPGGIQLGYDMPAAPTVQPESEPREERSLRLGKASRADAPTEEHDGEPRWPAADRKLSATAELLLQRSCLKALDLLTTARPAEYRALIKSAIESATKESTDAHFAWKDTDLVEKELEDIINGKGPLEGAFEDTSVTEVYIDGPRNITVLRQGKLLEYPLHFRSREELEVFLAAVLRETGRELSWNSPIVDVVLNDSWHSRLNALHPSMTGGDSPRAAIRIPRLRKISFYDILQTKTLPATLAAWLGDVVNQGEANILILGPRASGKTLMASALLTEISAEDRTVVVEGQPEICPPSMNVEKLILPPLGSVTLSTLLETALRRRPRRLLLGDLNQESAGTFLRMLEIGFSGSIACLCADYADDGLWRIVDMLAANERAPQTSLMRRITRSIHLVVAMDLVQDRPCLMEVAEVEPLGKDAEFAVKTLVRFEGVLEEKRLWKIVAGDSYWFRRVSQRGMSLKSGPSLLPYSRE